MYFEVTSFRIFLTRDDLARNAVIGGDLRKNREQRRPGELGQDSESKTGILSSCLESDRAEFPEGRYDVASRF
jgi:hypothetical protein